MGIHSNHSLSLSLFLAGTVSLYHDITLLHITAFQSFFSSFRLLFKSNFDYTIQHKTFILLSSQKFTKHFSYPNFCIRYFDRLHFCFLQALASATTRSPLYSVSCKTSSFLSLTPVAPLHPVHVAGPFTQEGPGQLGYGEEGRLCHQELPPPPISDTYTQTHTS